MTEPIFFEVPIYRLKPAEHNEYMECEEQENAPIENKKLYPESYENAYNDFYSRKWYAWRYNEIVGYLNLYIMGSQLRGDVWFLEKKRINSGIIKKKFCCFGKVFEMQVPSNKSSQEIFEFILQSVKYINKHDYKKLHFDLKTLKVIGQFVNWNELTKKLNSYTYPEHRKLYFEEHD